MSKFQLPGLGISLFCLALACVTSALGVWQHQRAQLKDRMQDSADQKLLGASVAIEALQGKAAEDMVWTPVFAVGTYAKEGQFLVENRVRENQVGYHVITPLALAGGGHVLVNRGWMPAGVSRETPSFPPAEAGEQTVIGVLAADSGDAFILGEDTGSNNVFLKLGIDAWQERTSKQAFPLVLLARHSEFDLIPVDIIPDFKADRSRGYRLQWFLLTLVAIGGWIALGLRRKKP